MRHRKRTFKLGRTSAHRGALVSNLLKSLVEKGRIETTVAKAKELKRVADQLITCAKNDTLASRREVISKLRLQYNRLTPKERRMAKEGNTSSYNRDRLVIQKLYSEWAPKYKERQGGYTRIIRIGEQIGDNAPKCLIEYV